MNVRLLKLVIKCLSMDLSSLGGMVLFCVPEKWEKACELFLEMEANGVEPDSIACSALMRAFNKGGEPSNVFILMDLMREKEVPFTGAVFFEIFSACNTYTYSYITIINHLSTFYLSMFSSASSLNVCSLQEWKRATDLIQMMEPYLPSLSIGLTNQMLHLFGKSGKVEAMMKVRINFGLYAN